MHVVSAIVAIGDAYHGLKTKCPRIFWLTGSFEEYTMSQKESQHFFHAWCYMLRPCVLYVRPSVASRSCIKTAKHIMTQILPYNRPETLVF